jgi:nickel-dependent lactate racemase
MHRPSTEEEKIIKLGAEVVSRYRVIDNEPQNPDALVDLGVTPGGVPTGLSSAFWMAFGTSLMASVG